MRECKIKCVSKEEGVKSRKKKRRARKGRRSKNGEAESRKDRESRDSASNIGGVSARDVEEMHEALKDIFGPIFEAMLLGEMSVHLGYESSERGEKGHIGHLAERNREQASMDADIR